MSDAEGNLSKWLATTLAVAAGVVVAATIAAAIPAAACMASVSALMYVGAGAKIAAGITYAVGTIASISAGAFAADGVYSATTGESPLLDTVFNGNAEAYSTAATITTLASGGIVSMATTGSNMGVCFVAGTLIATKNGKIPIQDIQAGDMVWSSNPTTGELALKPVVQTFVNETRELVHIHVNGEETVCTPEHPFYSPVLGWTEAIRLRAGDILVLVNGEYVIVEQVQHEILEAPIKVYNFEVEGFHTYFAGSDSILVHNDCSPLKGKEAKEAANKLGFKPTNYTSHGQKVFFNSKRNLYITPDVDGHNGGVWKMAKSVEDLGSKSTRMGTYDAALRWIGD